MEYGMVNSGRRSFNKPRIKNKHETRASLLEARVWSEKESKASLTPAGQTILFQSDWDRSSDMCRIVKG